MHRIKIGLHNHSQMSDGYFTIGGLLTHLDTEGYDVVAITDHNAYTEVHPIIIREHALEDLLILRGIEVTFPQIHIICLEPILHEHIKECIDTARVSYIAHPIFSMLTPEHCDQIIKKYHLHGVELYNGGFINYEGEIDGNFYAGDDLHIPSQVMKSWMEMNVGSLDKETIIEKLISGDYELKNILSEEDIENYTYDSLDYPLIR